MIEIIRERLQKHQGQATPEDALKEIIQEIALFGLWRAKFFNGAAFQGGTSLRILHGLPRFSEDLDFISKEPDETFVWSEYLAGLVDTLTQFGIEAEVSERGELDGQIRRALIKDDSLANQLDLSFYRGRPGQKLRIKLEIDVNPPVNSGFDYSFLDFPSDFEICHQDLSSNFALKIHALLCRPWTKGRDWYDFSWYVRNRVQPNLALLQSALIQSGPWKGELIQLDDNWLNTTLRERIATINWEEAKTDVERFLEPVEKEGLELWSDRFFGSRLDELMRMRQV
jgi:predicted nucleotidyltransferase component of viral defense system